MALTALLVALLASPAAGKESPAGSCGATPSPDCLNDMGSCGNACCAAEFESHKSTAALYSEITAYLGSGGSDGLFASSGGTGGLSIPTPQGPWTSIFQGTHTTFKARYVDTLDFALLERPGGGSMVRVFSISNIAGALGDMGQNRRTVSMLAGDLSLGGMKVLFGCGSSPSIPVSAPPGSGAKLAVAEFAEAGHAAPAPAASTSPGAASICLLCGLLTCAMFASGVWVGRRVEARHQGKALQYVQML